MSSQDELLKAAIAATQPFAFYATDIEFHVSRELNPGAYRDSLVLDGQNSLLEDYVKFQMAKKEGDGFDVVRFFTDHKVTLGLKPRDEDGAPSASSPLASIHVVLAAEYKVLTPLQDDVLLALLADHCALIHAYPYAREIIQTSFQRAGFQNITLPYLGKVLTGKVSGSSSSQGSGAEQNGR